MARLIDADFLKDVIEKRILAGLDETETEIRAIKMIVGVLDATPTVDPVKHGKWALPENVEIAITCICSECKNEFPIWAKKDYKYCPNCGARMDGEKTK